MPLSAETATPATVSFNRSIAPIIFRNCSPCHRPDQAGPFNLLTFSDVKKRAEDILEVVDKRIMPPWLPEPGYGHFSDPRLLSANEKQLLHQWVDAKTPEGDAADLVPVPEFDRVPAALGKPGLIIQMDRPYELPATGSDIYRNFVIPIPNESQKFVEAIEFIPGPTKAIHHAFFLVDPTRQSRNVQGTEVGFPGMDSPANAQSPEGQILSWQPGKRVSRGDPGLSWILKTNCDLVLKLHLQATGKKEIIQPTVALYFTDQAPTNTPFKIALVAYNIDIPPGEKAYRVADSYTLPVDVELHRITPHAHYLAHEMKSYAVLPNGTTNSLLWIKNWDFNWQGDYHYETPVQLPKGTTIFREFIYDNSAANLRNPHRPPQRVQFGAQTVDEMAELWLQVLTRTAAERAALVDDFQTKDWPNLLQYAEYRIRKSPAEGEGYLLAGKVLLAMNKKPRAAEAFKKAIELNDRLDDAHYYVGILARLQNNLALAQQEFKRAVELNPEHFKAHGNLGLIAYEQGRLAEAEISFRKALAVSSEDAIAHDTLAVILAGKGALIEAEDHLRAAVKLDPDNPEYRSHLEAVVRATKAK